MTSSNLSAKKASDDTDTVSLSRDQTDKLLHLQNNILHSVATSTEHQLVLDELCKTAESMLPNSAASIMTYDDNFEFLTVKSAPSIPLIAIEQLNGLIPGDNAGSCGTAVYRNTPQFVTNTLIDQRWAPFRQFAQDFSIAACWSMPIRTDQNESIGSFALSSFEQRQPDFFHKTLLETSASLASIILKRQQEAYRLEYAAHHDALTDLPNRILLNLRIKHAITRAARENRKLGLLFLDLDNFKDINDTQGHEMGDQVLKAIAQHITKSIRHEDTLARIGGDEFVLLLEDVKKTLDIRLVADKILKTFSQPIVIQNHSFAITTSIGVSIFPNDGTSAQTLLKNADIAMYEAKKQGRNTYEFYQPALTKLVQQRVKLESELRQALRNQEFIVYYQPIVDTQTQHLVSTEALVRWQHPTRGIISPDSFIPLAEETGLITELGLIVFQTACQQCVNWWSAGMPQFKLSINLSTKQITPGCTKKVIDNLSQLSFPINQLELEITETLIMEHSTVAIKELNAMRDAGIGVVLDDFGTGHSSLAKLKSLPINKLKIDLSFVRDIPKDKDDIIIVKTIIGMGKNLGLTVVAEGVETQEQQTILAAEGCDLLQGFLFSKPIPAEDFMNYLQKEKQNTE